MERLKQVLVESYIGAIALGWLLAQAVSQLAGAIVAPVSVWITRSQLRGFGDSVSTFPGFSVKNAVPHLISSVCLLLFWYLLLRWLYLTPVSTPSSSEHPEQEA